MMGLLFGWASATATFGQQLGAKLWEFEANGRISSSPAVGADGTVFFGGGTNLYAVNADKTLKWRFAAGGQVYSSPVVSSEGDIFFGCFDKKLYALKSNGTLRWTFQTQDRIYSSPAIDLDGTIYIGSDDNSLYAINPDGSPKWMFTTGGYIRSSPSIGVDGTVYFGSWDTQFYAVDRLGRQLWSFAAGHYVYSSPAIGADGTLYFGSVDKNLYALNPADGTKKWAFSTGSHVYSSPAIGPDGTIYVGSWDNRLYAVSPAGATNWSFVTGNLVQSSPAIAADGTVYIGSDENRLYAVTKDGAKKWAVTCGSLVRSSPAIAPDGTLYIGTEDNKLIALRGGSGLAVSPWPMFRADSRHRAKVLLVFTRQPQSRMVTVKHDAAFDVTAAGAGPLFYQWRFNGTNLPGATATNLVLTNIQPMQAGDYTVVVSNALETLTSSPASLRVVVEPVVTTQPQNQIVSVGGSASLRITANSLGPLTYQWTLNGTNIPAAIAPVFTVNEARATNAGNYAVILSNAAGSVTSSNAVLTVVAPPQITIQPENQIGAVGTNITFVVAALSATPLGYQWMFNGTNLPGSSASNLTLANIQPPNAGNYSVAVTNVAGSAVSRTATLTVTLPPIITVHPKSQIGKGGKSVTFTVEAISAGPLGYQWRFNESPLPGANLKALVLNNLARTNAGKYSVIVSNIAGAVTSASALLGVLVPPTIITSPLTQTGELGAPITLRVAANGSPPLSYFWRLNGLPVPSGTNESLQLSPMSAARAGEYTVVITNIAGSITSSPALLRMPRNRSLWDRVKGWF